MPTRTPCCGRWPADRKWIRQNVRDRSTVIDLQRRPVIISGLMNITILTYGSRGDVQPFLALALGLQKVGHTVKLAAPHRFADFVNAYDIPFVPLAGDPEIHQPAPQRCRREIPCAWCTPWATTFSPLLARLPARLLPACDDADLIIHSFLFTTGGHSMARKLGHPRCFRANLPYFCAHACLSACFHARTAAWLPELFCTLAAYPNILARREDRIQAVA